MSVGLTQPDTKVYVGFTSNPYTAIASIVWTDITSYVTAGKTGTGRNHELGVVEAGQATFNLLNTDGRFSPWNTSSPYYGTGTSIVPLRPVKVEATWSGTTYAVWFGYVKEWPTLMTTASQTWTPMTAVDQFAIWANKNITNLEYETTVLADTPVIFYRLGDVPGATVAVDSSGNSRHGQYNGTVTLGAAGAILTDADTSADLGARAGYVECSVAGTPITGTGSWSVEGWFKTNSPAVADDVLWDSRSAVNLSEADLRWGTTGVLHFGIRDDAGNLISCDDTTSVDDSDWHHVVCVRSAANTIKLYRDGALVATGTAGGANPNLATQLGMRVASFALAGAAQFDGLADEFAVYSTALSASDVAAHYAAGFAAFDAQTSGERFGTILDIIGHPAADRTIETGTSVLQPIMSSLATTRVLAYLQQVALTERGLPYQAPDGKITFLGRSHLWTTAASNTSQATFTDTSVTTLPYELAGTDLMQDPLDVYNEVPVARSGGATQTATDATSATTYGERTLGGLTDLLFNGDEEAVDRANFELSTHKDPLTRVRSLHLHPQDAPVTLFPQVLGRALWDRVTFVRTFKVGSTFSQETIIEGVEHQWTGDDWHTFFHLAAGDATHAWVLGDATFGVLDSTTKLGF